MKTVCIFGGAWYLLIHGCAKKRAATLFAMILLII